MKYLLLIALLVSCSKEQTVMKKNGLFFFETMSFNITDLRHIEWDVGLEKEKTVSKGLRVSVDIPKIDEDSVRKLIASRIDSFIYKIIYRSASGSTRPIGHIAIPFSTVSKRTQTFTLNLYYHAASVSKTFRLFKCPAFDHRYLLDDYDLESRNVDAKKWVLSRGDEIRHAVSTKRFSPQIVSTGRSMRGTYEIHMAMYNTKSKVTSGRWIRSNQIIKVDQEVKQSVASCVGIKEELNPLPSSRLPNIRDLEIK